MEKEKINMLWIITSEINDYNQEGQYFEMAFLRKPTLDKLSQFLYKCSLEKLNENQIIEVVHLFNGGGRKNSEHLWYHLNEVEEGKHL